LPLYSFDLVERRIMGIV